MSFSTFSGPLRAGTVREVQGRNTGLVTLAQTATVAMSGVALTAAPPAQLLFTLPAGSKILRFRFEKTTAISGNSVSAVNTTVGTLASANAYQTTVDIGLTTAPTAAATLDAALVSSATNNIGTADVPVYATFTAVTGNPTAGVVVVTVEYVQRAPDGSANPVSV